MTVFDDALASLRGIRRTLERLEAQRIDLSSTAQGMRLLANVVGVVGDTLRGQMVRVTALENDFGDHLLAHEKEYPSAAELQEWLAFMREERKKEAPLHE